METNPNTTSQETSPAVAPPEVRTIENILVAKDGSLEFQILAQDTLVSYLVPARIPLGDNAHVLMGWEDAREDVNVGRLLRTALAHVADLSDRVTQVEARLAELVTFIRVAAANIPKPATAQPAAPQTPQKQPISTTAETPQNTPVLAVSGEPVQVIVKAELRPK